MQTSGLTERKWYLEEVYGMHFNADYNLDSYFILESKDSSVTGKGECNSFFCRYEPADSNRITFSTIGATKMSCPKIYIEGEFFKALGETRFYAIHANKHLDLMNAEKIILARFKISE